MFLRFGATVEEEPNESGLRRFDAGQAAAISAMWKQVRLAQVKMIRIPR